MTALNRFIQPMLMAICALCVLFAFAPNLKAQTHVVSTEELKQQIQAVAKTREANVEKVMQLLSIPRAEKAFDAMHIDGNRVRTAVATLNDDELAQLAVRADKAKTDFAAGDLSDRDLLIIIAGIAALILIIVAVR